MVEETPVNESPNLISKDCLSLRESLIKRPGMYFGRMADDGPNFPVYELLANGIDQFLAGHASEISITIHESSISVTDNGIGFDLKKQNGDKALEQFLTHHHDTPTADNHAPHIHVGLGDLWGLGLAVLNAATSTFGVKTCNGKEVWEQRFEEGIQVFSEKSLSVDMSQGSTLSMTLDKAVFGNNKPNMKKIRKVIFDTTHLYQGLSITLNDETFLSHNGLLDYAYVLTIPILSS